MRNEIRIHWLFWLKASKALLRVLWWRVTGVRWRLVLRFSTPDIFPRTRSIALYLRKAPEVLPEIGSPSPWPATHPGVLVRWDIQPL
jgi:hypothetical protein